MPDKRFSRLPGGRLKRSKSRWGGDRGGGHDVWSLTERNRCLMEVLEADFHEAVEQVYLDAPEPEIGLFEERLWTLLIPCSGKFHNCTYIIEGDEELAIRIYAARNDGRHPEKISCDCGCGPDYLMMEVSGNLQDVTADLRNCPLIKLRGEMVPKEGVPKASPSAREYQTLEQFLAREDVIVIRERDISPSEYCEPIPRCTSPRDYSEDAQLVGWLLDAEF